MQINKEKNEVAFICPLYDIKNHFSLAYNLFKSKLDYEINADLFFIFSDEIQKEKFSNIIYKSFKQYPDSLVLNPSLLYLKSKVVVKKFFGLRTLMNSYQYIAIVDSESLFIKKGDYYKLFETIWKTQTTLVCNKSLDGFFILRTCFKTMGIYDNPILIKEFGHYKYTFWFNEIQVYKCANLPDFFEWLDKFDINGWGNEHHCFEYYIYAAFLIIEKGYHLKKTKYSSMGGIIEYLYNFPAEKQKNIIKDLGTHWSSNPNVTTENTYLLFHLDRTKEAKVYGYNISFLYKIKMYLMMYTNILIDNINYFRNKKYKDKNVNRH